MTPALATVNIDYVTVGNAGNAADTQVMNDATSGYGSVSYEYRIAKNETTIGQYAEFLNAVAKTDTHSLYNTDMKNVFIDGISRSGNLGNYIYSATPGSENKPINYVSWFDAARFCNWMHNGQPVGVQEVLTTESGAYTLLGAMSGVGFTVEAGAKFWIPSEDEWYKAAYYDPTKNEGSGGYWLHANQSDSMTSNSLGVAGAANFYDGDYAVTQSNSQESINYLTEVGAYGVGSESFYGTNDQTGNVLEWTDTVTGSSRVLRGGTWASDESGLRSSLRESNDPSMVGDYVYGFRVASVPEPSPILLAMCFSGMLLIKRKR